MNENFFGHEWCNLSMILRRDEVTSENHQGKLHHEWPKIIINGIGCIISFLTCYLKSEHTIPLKTIIEYLFHHCCLGWSFTVYPKKYAHGFCFAVICCGNTLTDFPISIRLTSLALWQSNDLTIAPVPAKQPWWIWINTSCEFIMNDCITTIKQSTTKPCAYFLGYTVWLSIVTSPRLIWDICHCDFQSVDCSCTCKLAQRNIEFSLPSIHSFACKNMGSPM